MAGHPNIAAILAWKCCSWNVAQCPSQGVCVDTLANDRPQMQPGDFQAPY
jgi:hypothetical protein